MKWTIKDEALAERLDLALSHLEAGTSRAVWQKRIKEGEIFVNASAVLTPHRTLMLGDVIEYHPLPVREIPLEERAAAIPLDIVSETPDWIVINKPAGLLVHPAVSAVHEVSLVDALLLHDPKISKIGPEPERPGIIHRLDREVSGLMIVAKTANAYDDLQKQFREHTIEKTYLALVHGVLERDFGDIRFKIARSISRGRMAARPEQDPEGKVAWTHYTVVERLPGATLLRVQILSGRTHQIRAHLFALGHPLIGDPLYTKRQTDRRNEAPRLMLQSIELAFRDPATGEKKAFTLAQDPAFKQLADAWRIQKSR